MCRQLERKLELKQEELSRLQDELRARELEIASKLSGDSREDAKRWIARIHELESKQEAQVETNTDLENTVKTLEFERNELSHNVSTLVKKANADAKKIEGLVRAAKAGNGKVTERQRNLNCFAAFVIV